MLVNQALSCQIGLKSYNLISVSRSGFGSFVSFDMMMMMVVVVIVMAGRMVVVAGGGEGGIIVEPGGSYFFLFTHPHPWRHKSDSVVKEGRK